MNATLEVPLAAPAGRELRDEVEALEVELREARRLRDEARARSRRLERVKALVDATVEARSKRSSLEEELVGLHRHVDTLEAQLGSQRVTLAELKQRLKLAEANSADGLRRRQERRRHLATLAKFVAAQGTLVFATTWVLEEPSLTWVGHLFTVAVAVFVASYLALRFAASRVPRRLPLGA